MKIFFKNIRAANDEQITKATSNEHEKKKKKMKKIDLSSSNIISGKFLNVGNSFPSTRLMQLITFTVSRH